MRKNHSKIVCIKLVHLPYLHVEILYDNKSQLLHQVGTSCQIHLCFYKHFIDV